ncbi:LOW QUALITY PROTEIN: tRNA-splicing endonuclease subunit Sen54 [Morone saxatilis]|uniref:LOW QUALITY PROTEIN: tRNA-splicing endonuclease subunit Sen54 n=1 Tax=Morone saxatilis TaxID=34816 RepID=UPI0015E1C26A|nr:LOW QUALITY PROTEIN: tRNA-splicing endonuclease subunit Sen54 [Morone saxatilis]
MAEQKKTDSAEKLFSEILSPSELFAARSRSHKIPSNRTKDCFPDDSDEQKTATQQSLNRHWSLVSEERIEKMGNLVKAVWVPSEQIVELQSPAGKFWQTMGFSADGKQHLLPEEALYLLECGNLQVFYRDLPLSIQDGYERFLSSSSVSLQQYQVFAHLKRLGYVVHRFDPSSEPSSYARQLNLLQSQRDRAGRQVKRKRSASPNATSSHTDVFPADLEWEAGTDAPVSGDSRDRPAAAFSTMSGAQDLVDDGPCPGPIRTHRLRSLHLALQSILVPPTGIHSERLNGSDEWRICFNVYQPDSVADFRKSNPGKPYARMCVCSFDGPVPDLRAMKLLTFQSGDVPVVFAVVDYGDISFYTFKDFQLPTDVFP